jgi:hypothetical protein
MDTFPFARRCPLEYIIEMQTVVETPSYLKAAEKLFSYEEREAIVAMVSDNPECGVAMSFREQAGFARFGSDAMEAENAREHVSFTSSATRISRFS